MQCKQEPTRNEVKRVVPDAARARTHVNNVNGHPVNTHY